MRWQHLSGYSTDPTTLGLSEHFNRARFWRSKFFLVKLCQPQCRLRRPPPPPQPPVTAPFPSPELTPSPDPSRTSPPSFLVAVPGQNSSSPPAHSTVRNPSQPPPPPDPVLTRKYFGVNYAVVISTCAAASLLGSPFSLFVFALVFVLWLALYFFREDPMVIWGHHVSDQVVMVGLILVSVLAVWFTGIFNSLLTGISVGILISTLHGLFRNPEGLFLDENDALASGLIGSQTDSDSYIVHFSNSY